MADDWKKKPTHTVYQVRDYENAKGEPDANWTPVGAAWVHKDGHGFNIMLEAFPRDGRLVMRLKKAKEKKAEDRGPASGRRAQELK